MSHHRDNLVKEELKKEFQLERMILFSDAVFAIVITLTAIEIKLPHDAHGLSGDEFVRKLLHLIPVFLAYAVSFLFIGVIWYRHLKLFSLLKTFDKGLVVRNLVMLFFIGLFPFAATIISSSTKDTMLRFSIYLSIIMACILSQFFLQHYVLIKKPGLRNDNDITELLAEHQKSKYSFGGMAIALVLMFITNYFIADPALQPLSTLWFSVFAIVFFIKYRKKKK